MKINQLINQPFVHSDVAYAFSDRAFVQAMLDFELSVIQVRESNHLIPCGIFQQTKHALALELFDIESIGAHTYLGGNAAIPFVTQAKALLPSELKPYFHQTLTSQDVIDTAMMILLKPSITRINQDLFDVLHACKALIQKHCTTPMAGRTLMQQALPITFGAKVSQWAASLLTVMPSLTRLEHSGCYLQWGGPVGVSNEENEHHNLPQQVAESLGLSAPMLPWHTNRQPIHAIASALDACAGAIESIVEDIALMSQSELGEIAEPAIEGMGGSSSMPHKRNPVLCALIKTSALRMHGHLSVISNTTAQPFERALGQWHASWVPLTEGAALIAGAVAYLKTLLQGLQVYPERMAANLDLNSNAYLIKALEKHFETDSQMTALIRQASEQAHRQHIGFVATFFALLAEQPNDSGKYSILKENSELKEILSPLTYCGAAQRQCQVLLTAIDEFTAPLDNVSDDTWLTGK